VSFFDILRAVRRSWILIALVSVIGAGVGGSWAMVSTPVFEAETELFVSVQPSAPDVNDVAQGNTAAQQKVSSYVAVVTSASVLQPVIDELDLGTTVAELADRVTAKSPANSVLIDITVRNTEPAAAKAVANAVAQSLIHVVTDRLEKPASGGPSLVRPEVIQPAVEPTAPATPNLFVDVLLGLVGALGLGIAGALLRQAFDTKVRTTADIVEVTDAPLLGAIGENASFHRQPLVVQADPLSPVAEAFRALRTNVQFIDLDNRTGTFTITSALPGEGKSTTAANLAIAMSENGARVALVDADLRRPRLAGIMGIEGSAGLTDVILGRAELVDVLVPWGRGGLQVLPAGRIPPNPSELLGSFATTKLVEHLAQEFDAVIFDAPPLLPVTDAAVLSRVTGGAVVVAAAEQTGRNQLAAALAALDTIGAATLGIVLSKVPRKRAGTATYGSYHDYREVPPRVEPSIH